MSTLMTNLLPIYSNFLKDQSKRTKKTKRQILEEAIALYMKEIKRRALMAQYQKMGQDEDYQNELVEGAEIGMDYFLMDIDNEG